MATAPRNYKVLVQKRSGKGMREVVWRGRKRFTRDRAKLIVADLKKAGRNARAQKILTEKQANDLLIRKWLSGDLDFDRKLMVKLAKVARDSGTKIHVNYGKRTYAEQLYLWNKYGPPRAAKPGTSRHETGLAADCVTRVTRRNVGDVSRVRAALKKHGLCLPVPNEPWHVEQGSTFRA
jgi:hypothetical protein